MDCVDGLIKETLNLVSIIRSPSLYGLVLHEVLSRKGDYYKMLLILMLANLDKDYY